MLGDKIKKYKNIISNVDSMEMSGTVSKVVGITVESNGPMVKMGDICKIYSYDGEPIMAEVVGFRDKSVLLMPFGSVSGIGTGNRVVATGKSTGSAWEKR
jgi:flagellum-specific ATP synthase